MSSAHLESVRRYRSDPEKASRERARNRAANRALHRLANCYPDTFAELCNEEREKGGLPPLGEAPVGRPPRGAA